MKKHIWNTLLIAILLTSFSCGNKKDDSKEVAEDQNEEKFDDSKIEKDTEFAVAAADGGMLEVQLGELAQTNGASAGVKEFGKTMADEHGKANAELKALAASKNITLPGALSDKCQKKYNDLVEKKGADFDKDYIDLMVSDHKDDIDKFEKEADKGNDADVKTWASGKLPTLRHHLEMAQQTQDALKNNH
jgi:putative membrane protein